MKESKEEGQANEQTESLFVGNILVAYFFFSRNGGKAIYSRPVILDLSKFSVGGGHSGEGSGQRKRAK